MKTAFRNLVTKRLLCCLMILTVYDVSFIYIGGCRKNSGNVSEQSAPVEGNEATEPDEKIVLPSMLAGRWYASDANALREQIKGFFEKANVQPKDNVIALILPHAGYSFSGQIAAYGVKTAAKQYKRIVVIGPSHGTRMEVLSVPGVTHYQTLLSQVPLDVEFIDKLLKYPIFQNVPVAHKYEHSVQIELPLFQYCQKDFEFVPIIAGQCPPETIAKAAAIIKGLIDADTLVVASSDFVHYGQSYGYVPFNENIPERIKEVDMGAYEHIARLDSDGFLEYRQKSGATICGYVPIAILLGMMDDTAKAELLKYTTSGELTGDYSTSVSYLSAAFYGQWANCSEVEPEAHNAKLTEQDEKQLLILARRTINHVLQNGTVPDPSELGVEITDAMKPPRAAFVTLKKHSQLRGCIGDIYPQQPLYKSVMMNAIYASFRDRRFSPVKKEECDDIKIEISILTVPKPVASADDIRIGVDGVVLYKDGKSALFLPQVATEQGWDIDEMLTHLSLKAQLPGYAWKDGASFRTFQARVFGEE
jgi:AmmeMemoRadiSam system protein B/AmmeMemoRadiSam system protein A